MKRIGKQVADATKQELKGRLMSEWDRKNLAFLISLYERAYPGYIRNFIKQSRKEVVEDKRFSKEYAKGNFAMSRRISIPLDLLTEIKRGYPAIISDKGQMEQFLAWFPQFDLWRVS